MTEDQRRFSHAKSKFVAFTLDPARELLDATTELVNAAIKRADDAEKALEELRPVWAQGFSSDSEAAQANGNALAQLWKMLGVDNQTAAVQRLGELGIVNDRA